MKVITHISKDFALNTGKLHCNVGIRLVLSLLVRLFRSENITKFTADFSFLCWTFSVITYHKYGKQEDTLKLMKEEIEGMTDAEAYTSYDELQHYNDVKF